MTSSKAQGLIIGPDSPYVEDTVKAPGRICAALASHLHRLTAMAEWKFVTLPAA